MNKEILDQILECLSIITINSNVYSAQLRREVDKLSKMIEEYKKENTSE